MVRNNGHRTASVNAYGDFVAPVHTNNVSSIYYLFGAIDDAAPAALRREAMLDGVTQNSIISGVGVGRDGTITYGAALTGSGSPGSLWQNDTLVYQRGDAIPSGPLVGNFFGDVVNRVFTSPSGQVTWSMNYASVSGGVEAGVALMRGVGDYKTLLRSGDEIGAVGTVSNSGSFVFTNPVYSLSGTNYMTAVELEEGGSVMTVNGEPVQFGSGGVALEGALIPAADGGMTDDGTPDGEPIEQLVFGSNFAVNEAGDYAYSAFTELTTDGDTNVDDHLLIYNGSILYREGDVVDGVTLDGQFEGVGLNDRGDLVFGWDDKLFVNGKLVAEIGAPLQLPGGGLGTLDSVAVSQITVSNQVAAGGDGLPVVYFSGSTNPSDLSALMRFVPQTALDGDFNQDGVVDAADYVVWRDTLGSVTDMRADANRSGEVDPSDYGVWRANYGNAFLSPTATSVPEPGALIYFALMALGVFLRPNTAIRCAISG